MNFSTGSSLRLNTQQQQQQQQHLFIPKKKDKIKVMHKI